MERRRFCQLTGVALATTTLPLVGCGSGGGGTGIYDVGPTSIFAVGDANLVQEPGFNVYICHDAAGFYALSANCTHAHCIVQFNDAATGFQCNCHNSTFDFNGQHNTPPAPGPLPHFKVSIQNGEVIVDSNTMVDPSVRVAG